MVLSCSYSNPVVFANVKPWTKPRDLDRLFKLGRLGLSAVACHQAAQPSRLVAASSHLLIVSSPRLSIEGELTRRHGIKTCNIIATASTNLTSRQFGRPPHALWLKQAWILQPRSVFVAEAWVNGCPSQPPESFSHGLRSSPQTRHLFTVRWFSAAGACRREARPGRSCTQR